MDPKDQPLTALERQNVDSGTVVFDTEDEMREYMRAFQLEHEAVLKAVAEVHGPSDEDEEVDDLDVYYGA